MDYAMPRADLLPAFDTEVSEVPSTTNPLGMRGGSEGGITPGLAGVMQINFEVPTSIGTGSEQVVVTIGDVSSPAAILNVAN